MRKKFGMALSIRKLKKKKRNSAKLRSSWVHATMDWARKLNWKTKRPKESKNRVSKKCQINCESGPTKLTWISLSIVMIPKRIAEQFWEIIFAKTNQPLLRQKNCHFSDWRLYYHSDTLSTNLSIFNFSGLRKVQNRCKKSTK